MLEPRGTGRDEEPSGEGPPADSDLSSEAEVGKISSGRQAQFAASVNRPFQFQKRGQLFIRTHNEPPSRRRNALGNPDRPPFAVQT